MLTVAMEKLAVIPVLLMVILPGSPLSAAPVASARTPFDGAWIISVVTDSGDCDRAYRYEFEIVAGKVYYDDLSFDISGQVDARGQVSVTIRHGQQQAVGTGRLSRDDGEGSWSGSSLTTQCSGHWEAERHS